MALVIVWEQPDGSILITYPVAAKLPGEADAAYLDRVAAHAQARDLSLTGAVRRPNADSAALPARRWRNAWRRVAGSLTVHPATARVQRRLELLADRDTRLDRVRKKLQNAIEDDAATATIAALKAKAKALRGLDDTLAASLVAVPLADLGTWEPPEFQST
jgi:hypothetical protein